jgi:hypothetical protein
MLSERAEPLTVLTNVIPADGPYAASVCLSQNASSTSIEQTGTAGVLYNLICVYFRNLPFGIFS